MTPREFRQEQEFEFDHFQKLTDTGIKPNYVNIEMFAHEYHKRKLKLLGIADVSKRYFLFSGQEDGKPTKYLVDDCDDRETAIAKIETEYPNFKWVMTETFNAC